MKTWMTRPLINDHVRGSQQETNLIGIITHDDGLPRAVSCGPLKYNDYLSLNLLRDEADGMHLTTSGAFVLSKSELAELKEKGIVRNGSYVVRLIEEPA